MLEIVLLILAGCGSGMINAVAGGGNLLVLPVFLALGLNPFAAVITGSITAAPASFASAYGYRKDLLKLPRSYFLLLIPCIGGGSIGISLLHYTPGGIFEKFLPWLVMTAVALFIFQPQLHKRLRKPVRLRYGRSAYFVVPGLFLACIWRLFWSRRGLPNLGARGLLENTKHLSNDRPEVSCHRHASPDDHRGVFGDR